MNTPIQYLNGLLILSAMMFPTALGANISILFKGYKSRSVFHSLIGMLIAYAMLIAILMIDQPRLLKSNYSLSVAYLLISVLGAAICYGIELIVGLLLFYIKNKRLPKKIIVHAAYSAYMHTNALDYGAIILYVIFEEYILRVVMYNIITELCDIPPLLLVAVMSAIYALNHLTFGMNSVIQKFFSGMVLSLLYVYTGCNVIYPMIAHASFNVALLAFSQRRAANGS